MTQGGATRFGQPHGNKPKPGGAGTGSWKKSETKRKVFEDIVDMSLEEYSDLIKKPQHTVFETLVIRATTNALNNKGLSVDDLMKLIDGFEPKPAQRIEQTNIPAPIPLLDLDEIKKKAKKLRGKHTA